MKEIRLYINKRCQLKCDFCSYKYLNSCKGDEEIFYKYDLKEKLFQLLKRLNCMNLMISGKEPLFDDKWFDYIVYMKSRFDVFFTHINTNGISLKNYDMNRLVQLSLNRNHLDRLLISVNYKETEEQFRKVLKWSKKASSKVQPYMVIEKDNIEFLKDMIKLGIDNDITKYYLRFMIPLRQDVKDKIIPIQDQDVILYEFLEMINEYQKHIFIQSPLDYKLNINEMTDKYINDGIIIEDTGFENITMQRTFPRYWCHQYQDSITILHNGDIVGCAKHTYKENYKRYVISNFLTDDIETIINNIKVSIENTNLNNVCLPTRN